MMGSHGENKPKIKRRNIYHFVLALVTIIVFFGWFARFYTKGLTSGMEMHYYTLPRRVENLEFLRHI